MATINQRTLADGRICYWVPAFLRKKTRKSPDSTRGTQILRNAGVEIASRIAEASGFA